MPTASGSQRLARHISISPDVIRFENITPEGDVYSASARINNLDQTGPRSVRIKAPTTKWFKIKGINHTERIAPGLSVTFEVLFNPKLVTAADTNRDGFHDCIKITSEKQDVELWVHAMLPRPQLQLQGDLQFGMVGVESKPSKQLQLTNTGQMPAEYKLDWDRSLPVTVEPQSGTVLPGNTTFLSAKLAAAEVGAIIGELVVTVTGRPEPYRHSISATVVQQSYELTDTSNAAISELNFGSMFNGEAVARTITIANSGPAEARYDLSYGSKADMAAIAATEGGSSTADDQHSAFLRMARIRAKLREDKELVVRVSPISGTIAPYSTAQLTVTFRPPAAAQAKGFKAQPLDVQQQPQLFDYLLQVNMPSGKLLRLPIRGYGLGPHLSASPQIMHFGVVPTYEWADQLLELSNSCQELPMHVEFDRSGPYFAAEPAQVDLPPGASASVLVRYLPKALGRHQASLSFQVVSTKVVGKVLAEALVQVLGQSLSLGSKKALPGGPAAIPATFTKPRAYVDEAQATLAGITAGASRTFKRHALWETDQAIDSLEGIGPMDRFGVTREVQIARKEHADQYTTFIRSGRTAAAKRYLTDKEGEETDTNLGMKPYRGLSPSRLVQPKQYEPLWTAQQQGSSGPSVQRPPSASALSTTPIYKEWPETDKERTECSKELPAELLSKVIVGPRQLDFGKISPALPATQHFVVKNTLNNAVHVVLDTSSLEELSCTSPASQVIPAGATAKFQLSLRCHDVQLLKEKIQYCINGCHIQSVDVVAEVVAVTLELSNEELMFSFSLDNWDNYVEKSLIMENTHNFAVEYEWVLASQNGVFAATPVSGIIKPKSSSSVVVRWTPGNAPPPAAPKLKAAAANASADAAATVSRSGAVKRSSSKNDSKVPAITAADGTKTDAAPVEAAARRDSAVTVSLTAGSGPDAAAVADAAALGCQHTGFMTLKVKGRADVAPKKIMLLAELPAGLLKFKEKEVNLGPVPLLEQQTAVVQLKNYGIAEASFRVHQNSQLQVSPDRGYAPAEGTTVLEVLLSPQQPGHFAATLEVEVRGGKALKLPIRAEGVLPSCHVAEGSLPFPDTFIGSSSQLPLTLVNTTPVPATLICDFIQQPEFDIMLSRDAWAGAGYTACPVQKIGANGEISTVGSKRASKRGSRRMTSQGGKPPLAGGSGYRFLVQMKPSSQLPLQLIYRPSRSQPTSFPLPMVLHNNGAEVESAAPVAAPGSSLLEKRSSTPSKATKPGSAGSQGKGARGTVDAAAVPEPARILAVQVSANGVVPKLIISKSTIDFESQVVRSNQQPGKSPYAQEIYARNNTEGPLQVAIGSPSIQGDTSGCLGIYGIEGLESPQAFISLEPGEGFAFTIRFSPQDARSYEAVVPVYTDENQSAAYLQLSLLGSGVLPQLTFSAAECLLPSVPLNVTSRARFYVINGGYENLELTVRLPPDTSRLPISLSFPEGNLIGLAKDRLPVDVTFCCSRPQSFTALVEFLDESGRSFSIAVTGSTDSCSLTHQPFMQVNNQQLLLAPSAEGSAFVKLVDSPTYEMPWDEAIGPQRLTEGLVKYLSAVTSRNWTGSDNNRGKSTSSGGGAADASMWSDAVEKLRQLMRGSKGKQLIELVEMLGGKPVSLKGAGSKKTSGNKTEAAQQALVVYEAILNHLRAHGGLVNAVKPEYLLDSEDFDRIMEARTAAAAGNAEQEQELELWAPVEQSFGVYSTQAWNTILLQVFRMYCLARITPAALQQLLGTTASSMESNKTATLPKAPAANTAQAAASPASKAAASPATSTAGAHAEAAPAAAVTGHQVPDNELLGSSNIFNVPETCLLTWMSIHAVKAFPGKITQVTNFATDLRNGLVLGGLLAAHWPSGSTGALLTKLHPAAQEGRHLRENQDLVVRAMQELCLPYEVTANDLDEAESSNLLMLVAYLFTALPQLLPRATLDFTCKLAEQQVRDIQLANPTRRVLSYAARLEGSPDFSLEASIVKIEPGRSTQVPVCFAPTTSVTKSSRLVLMSRRDGSSASAATLVFLLRGSVESRVPLKQITVQSPLYQLGVTDFSVINPFPADCEFTISIVDHKPPAPPATDKKGKGSKTGGSGQPAAVGTAAKAAATKKAQQEQLQQQQQAVANLFPQPFGLDRHRLRLRAGASEKLKLSFLPFQLPALQQSEPAAPGKLPVLKGLTHSLLVLSDSECGDFAYGLCGEVMLPVPFLEHKATVGLDGSQIVELQLPFNNNLLESARRTFTDKHPLAKDKEQAAKLRSDIGRTNDKGERLLEYTVTCSNSLMTVPQTLVLRAAATPASAAAAAAAASGRSAVSTTGAVVGMNPPASPPMQQQRPVADKDSKSKDENILKLQLKPLGTGIYPARLTLTSLYDVRVVAVEVTAQSMGQTAVLEMECPARQQVLQEIPLINTTDAPFSATATLTGKGFCGPRDLSVPAKSTSAYPLTFSPPGTGSFTGTMELNIAATGERNVYTFVGKGGEPLAEGHLVIECQARSIVTKRLQVPNVTGTLPLVYNVYADLEILSGPATHACTSTSRGDTYKLSITPLRSSNSWGSVSFVTDDGQYCWYSVEVKASEPPDMGTIQVSCPVRQAVSIKVTLTNPTDKPLLLRSQYSIPSLVGPPTMVAPPKEPCVFECYYAPLLLKKEEGVLRLISDEAGEFWWNIQMEATPGGPEQLPLLTAPLGRCSAHPILVSNPTAAEAHFNCTSSDAMKFTVSPSSVTVPAHGSAEVVLEFRPGSLGTEESAAVTVTSETAGSVEYVCRGQGEMPSGSESTSINSALSTATASNTLSWVNPFNQPARVKVQLSSWELPGTYNLQLPGVQAVAQTQTIHLQRQHGMLGRKSKGAESTDDRDHGPSARITAESSSGSAEQATAQDAMAQQRGRLDSLESNESDADHLERASISAAPPPGWQEAMGGFLGDILNRTKPPDPPQQPDQPPQQPPPRPPVIPQQVAEVVVQPNAALQLPVSFCPTVLHESDAELSVTLVSPEIPAPQPLTWQYQVRGLAYMDTQGVKFEVKCKAKHSCDEVLAVPLPGLDSAAIAAIAGASKQDAASHGVTFTHELIVPQQHKAALASALTIERLNPLPLLGAAAAAAMGPSGAAAAADAPVMRYKLCFAPQKAIVAGVQLAVICSTGARWVYDVNLTSTAPEIEGILTLEAHMGCTAELPLMLYSSGPTMQPFTAEFTPESPLNFDARPASGLLPPMPQGGQALSTAAAPIKITFLCKEMGKVMTGKLLVVTPDSQHTFLVKGRQPAYVPPSKSDLPSGTYLTGGTASTTARLESDLPNRSASPAGQARSRSATVTQAGSPVARRTAASAERDSRSPTARTTTGRNYLQQNIKATKAASTAASGSRGSSGDGSKKSTADGRCGT